MKKVYFNIVRACIFFLFLAAGPVLSAANYFWVGGSGNWSDINHWATTSGGTTTHTSVPSVNDDVFFNANSFSSSNQTVTVNVSNAVCRNMSWTGAGNNPTLAGGWSAQLDIYGSLTLITGMSVNYNGSIYFEATSTGKTLATHGKTSNAILYFNGNNGGWTLSTDLEFRTLNLNKGSLNTNNYDLEGNSFQSNNTSSRGLNLGTSEISVSTWNVTATNLSLSAGNSTINSLTGFNSAGAAKTYNDLFFSGNGNLNANNGTNFNDVVFNQNGTINGNCNYDKLKFLQNGNINGSNTIDSLIFTEDNTYTLNDNQTQTIVVGWDANATCSTRITIQSAQSGSNKSTVYKASGTVLLTYVMLEGIQASGNANFGASSSVNLGNNANWSINAPSGRNLFWVGGSGNWNDKSHWATSPCGSGGACLPTKYDNVFFAQCAFTGNNQTITVNMTSADCNNMTWSNLSYTGSFSGNGDLNIYGNLTLHSSLNFNFFGTLSFEATSTGKTITTSGKSLPCRIEFNGTGGGWILQDALTFTSNLHFNIGVLNTGSYDINGGNFISNGSSNRALFIGTSDFDLTRWNINAQNLNYNSSGNYFKIQANFRSAGSVIDYDTVELAFGGSMNNNVANTYRYVKFAGDNTVWNQNSLYDKAEFLGQATIYGSAEYDTLIFTAGHRYTLQSGATQKINDVMTGSGTCGERIEYRSSSSSQATVRKTSGNVTVSHVLLEGIAAAGGATFTANNAIDFGGNSGWTLNALLPRTLYWVGGTGNWTSPSNWSLSSGGSGGECPPTYLDSVFFDANSFTGSGQTVTLDARYAYCKNIDWTGVQYNPTFTETQNVEFNIYGSLKYVSGMSVNINGYSFHSTTQNNVIRSAGKTLSGVVEFLGSGKYTLLDNLSFGNISISGGSVDFNKKNATGNFIMITNTANSVNIDSSNITVASWNANSNFNLSAKGSFIKVNNNFGAYSFHAYHDVEFIFFGTLTGGTSTSFRNVIFNNSAAISGSNYFNNVYMAGDGTINGANTFDTLTFSPGHTYTLAHSQVQRINDVWNILGNPCFPITLRSSLNGFQATVFKPSGSIAGDNIQMRDIRAFGNATFFAGGNSTDISNNSGWNFNTLPGFISGLGADTTICIGDTLVLGKQGFNGGLSFRWQNSFFADSLIVTSAGTYFVRVNFGSNCAYTDTIHVSVTAPPAPDLGNDTAICIGDEITLSPNMQVPRYFWSDSTSSPTLKADSAGIYWVEVFGGYCYRRDSIEITFRPTPVVELGSDTVICNGQSVLADAGNMGSTFLWSNNDTTQSTNFNTAGSHWVKVTQGLCTREDTLQLHVRPPLQIIPRADTSLCSPQNVLLYAGATGGDSTRYTFHWSNGLGSGSSKTVMPQTTTRYMVVVTDSCTTEPDTAYITVGISIPLEVTAMNDTTICKGVSFGMYANAAGGNLSSYTFQWDNGAGAGNPVSVAPDSTTTYRVILTDICNQPGDTDYVKITVREELNVTARSDTTICLGSQVMLSGISSGGNGNYYYLWDNGLPEGNNQNVAPDTTTTYRLILSDSCTTLPDTDYVTITVRPPLNVQPRSDTTICIGQQVRLFATATGGDTTGHLFTWNNGIGNGSSHFVSPDTTTEYQVVLSDGCVTPPDTAIVRIIVRPPLNAMLTADTTLCLGQDILLQVQGTGGDTSNYTFTWDNGLGSGADKLVSPKSTTGYEVILSDNCTDQPDTANMQVEVRPALAVSPRADTMICFGQSVDLYATGTGGDTSNYFFIWNNGVGTGMVKPVSPSTTTTYRVVLTDSCSSEPDTGFVTIYVRQALSVTARPDTTICIGENVVLSATATGGDSTYVYTWNQGVGTGNNKLIAPDTTTTYQVLLSDNCTAPADSDEVTVTVRPPLSVIPRSDTTICAGQQVRLSATGSGGDESKHIFNWDNGIGDTNNVMVSPVTTTTYRVVLSDNCTDDPDTAYVKITVRPVLSVTARTDTTICIGAQVQLSAVASGGETSQHVYTWNQGLGTGRIQNVSPDSTTTYEVVLTDNCTSVPDTDAVTVYVRPALGVNAGIDTIICIGQSTQLTATATGGDSSYFYTWNQSLGNGRTHQVFPETTTTYRVILSDNCTQKNDTDEITVYVRQPLEVTPRLDTFFCNGQGAKLYATATGGDSTYTYTWNNGVGSGNYIFVDPDTTTTYQVILSDGCTADNDTGSVTFNVRVPLNLVIPPDTLICIGEEADLHVEGTGGDSLYYTYIWDQGLGTGNNKKVTPDTTTTYQVILTDNCTKISDTGYVHVSVRKPLQVIPRLDTMICRGQNVHLYATAAGGDSTGYTFTWNQGAGQGNAVSVAPDTTTTYRVILTDNCTSDPDTAFVTISVRPPLQVESRSDTIVCIGQSVELYATASGGNSSQHILEWSHGVGQGNFLPVSPDTTTTYRVVLTDGCTSLGDTGYVTIFVRPPLSVSPRTDTIICIGQSVQLSASGTGGDSTYIYTWNHGLGDGISHLVSPEVTTAYEVILKDHCTVDADTATVTVTVRPPLQVTPMKDTTICTGQQVALTATAGGGDAARHNLLWDHGLGSGNSIPVSPDTTTTYRVILTDNCTDDPDTGFVTVFVREPLQVQARTDTVLCIGQQVQLYATASGGDTSGYYFTWNQGVGTGNDLTVQPEITTTYQVILRDNCTSKPDTAETTITVRPPLTVVPRSDTLICVGQPVTLFATGAGGDTANHTFTWDNGLGNGPSFIVQPDSTTTYQVILKDGCTVKPDTAEVTVQVRPPLQVDAGRDTTICLGRSVMLQSEGIGGVPANYEFTWDNGLGTGDFQMVTPDSTTTYKVVLRDYCTVQPDSSEVTVNVLPPLQVTPRPDTLICIGEKVMLYADAAGGPGTGYKLEWDHGLGFGNYIEVDPSVSTTYRVVLHDSCTVFPDTAFVTVNVRDELKVNAFGDTSICAGGTAVISAQGRGGDTANHKYSWNHGVTDGQSHLVNPLDTITYVVTLDDGCSMPATDSVKVNVEQLPVVDFYVSDSVACLPLAVQFFDSSVSQPGSLLHWSFGDNASDSVEKPIYRYAQSGTYNVKLIITSPLGCTDSLTKAGLVTINPKPVAAFIPMPEKTDILNPEILFQNESSGGSSYRWDFGDYNGTSFETDPFHEYRDTGSYPVTLITENEFGCSDTIIHTIRINDFYQLWVPTAFSPNGDDRNEEFRIDGTGIRSVEMVIYNRWGERVASIAKGEGWNGRYFNTGDPLPVGVYIFRLKVVDFEHKFHVVNGNVTLVR